MLQRKSTALSWAGCSPAEGSEYCLCHRCGQQLPSPSSRVLIHYTFLYCLSNCVIKIARLYKWVLLLVWKSNKTIKLKLNKTILKLKSLQVSKLDDPEPQTRAQMESKLWPFKTVAEISLHMPLRHYIRWKWTWNPQRMVKAWGLNTFVHCEFILILKYPHCQVWCHSFK